MNAAIDWGSRVFVTLGGVVVVSIGQIIDLVRHRWLGTLTTGRVIKLEEQESSEGGGPVFTPIIEYRVDERRRRIKSLIAMSPALYRVGQEVPVYYIAGSPEIGRVVTAREFFKWGVVIASCLLFLAVLMASKAN
jgi:hypothetical protein